jgi:pSer/pThr/pTyr-binding forkhead associated (FHA) protein
MKLTISFQGKEEVKDLAQTEVVIGRWKEGAKPDIDLVSDLRVSRPHARIWEEGNQYWIEDLGSKRGTKVNGEEIKGHGRRRLRSGDRVLLGETTLRLEGVPAEDIEIGAMTLPLSRREASGLEVPVTPDAEAAPSFSKGMSAKHVFVSYSSKDKPTADAVCAELESHGIRCWVAPRDILPGHDWGGSIIEAINGSRVMVLIFSANANTSPQIKREVERAVSKGIPVIPFRIEDVAPVATLEYFISTPHWLDAFTPPLERHLRYLADAVRKVAGGPEVK